MSVISTQFGAQGRRYAVLAARGLIGVALLVGVIWYVELGAIVDTLQGGHPGWMAFAAVLILPNILLDGWVWKRILDSGGVTHSFDRILRAVMAGYAAGFFTPARIGEFAGRAYAVPSRDRWTVSLTVLAQRVVDTAVALMAGLIAIVGLRGQGLVSASFSADASETLPPHAPLPDASMGWVDVAVMGTGLTVTLLLGAIICRPSAIDRLARRWLPNFDGLHARTETLSALDASDRAWVVAGSMGRYVLYGSQLAILVHAFDATAPFLLLAVGVGITYFLKHLIPSLTLLDVGIREGAAVLAFGLIGVSSSAALNGSLAIFAFNVALPAALGVPFLSSIDVTHSTDEDVDERSEPAPSPRGGFA